MFCVTVDISDIEEVSHPKDVSAMRNKVQQLYDMRINRFKARFSAMYPAESSTESVNLSRFRTASMLELVSYLDTRMQLRLKSVNHYFRKLIAISHSDVSLTTRAGWSDIIHLSTFLKRIRLYGEPLERDLHTFTKLLENDGFTELTTLEVHYIGEWALLEILEALSRRVQRALRINFLSDSISANLIIQETDFTPFFVKKFAELTNLTLCLIFTGIHISVKEVNGIEMLLKEMHLSKCSRLLEVDFSGILLGRHGFELVSRSLWKKIEAKNNEIPRLTALRLAGCGLTDNCIRTLCESISSGYLSNLQILDLSANRLTIESVKYLSVVMDQYYLPNLLSLILSDNIELAGGSLASLLLGLSRGTCPLIEHLELNHCGLCVIDLDGLGVFLTSPYSENIKTLNLGNNPGFSAAGFQFFQCLSLSPCRSLEVLNLEGTNLGAEMLPELDIWLRHGNLQHLQFLYLNNNALDQKCYSVLLRGLLHSNIKVLRMLDVSSNLIGSFDESLWEQIVYVDDKSLIKPMEIYTLDLCHNPLSNEDMLWITRFMQTHISLQHLREASFEDSNISARGIGLFLAGFPKEQVCDLTRLSVISLSLRCIGRDLRDWLCSPAASCLKKLVLMNCNLCKADLTFLINAFEVSEYCKQLQVIKLSGNFEVDDTFVQEFVRVYSIEDILPMIYELDISYTSMSKVGAYALLEFFSTHHNYSLRRLNLAYTKLSEHRINILFDEFKRIFKGGCMF